MIKNVANQWKVENEIFSFFSDAETKMAKKRTLHNVFVNGMEKREEKWALGRKRNGTLYTWLDETQCKRRTLIRDFFVKEEKKRNSK